jgi:hypothetical protein
MKKHTLKASLFAYSLTTLIFSHSALAADVAIGGVTWPSDIYAQMKLSSLIKGMDHKEVANKISYGMRGKFKECTQIIDKSGWGASPSKLDSGDPNVVCYKFQCDGYSWNPHLVLNYATGEMYTNKSCSVH